MHSINWKKKTLQLEGYTMLIVGTVHFCVFVCVCIFVHLYLMNTCGETSWVSQYLLSHVLLRTFGRLFVKWVGEKEMGDHAQSFLA